MNLRYFLTLIVVLALSAFVGNVVSEGMGAMFGLMGRILALPLAAFLGFSVGECIAKRAL